jgi:hypothetical protein
MDEQGLSFTDRDALPLDLAASIGIILKKDAIDDVVPGSPADYIVTTQVATPASQHHRWRGY